RNKDLRNHLYEDQDCPKLKKSLSSKTSRRLRLFRAHGLIKKVSRNNRYVLTKKRCKVATTVLAASNVDTEQLMDNVI
ncbi:MAG: hypothetical protein PHO37_15760, partial [Kiritimatiellae bacterium]|nr:hypothetical protein [Kiritimatiellia bacterium]